MNRIARAGLCVLLAMSVAAPAVADRGYKDHRGHKDYHGYKDYRGYREHPYDRHRHYERYEHRGRHYDYRGHWRSWHEWDAYYRGYPWMHEHGYYYHDEGHLMFRFCDPETGSCFFFSIGM